MIDINKKYQTVSGRKVTLHEIKVYTSQGYDASFPVKGTIDFSDINGKKKKGSKLYTIWTIDGHYDVMKKTKFDLVEVL
jgi:hypothetical protein